MRGNAFIAFFGIATALSGALVGCGDDSEEDKAPAPAKITKSQLGESCVRTDDCDTGLACFSNVCLEEPSGTGGTDSTGGTGGKGGTTSTLGTEGETCSRRADCAPPLGCFNGRCASTGSGEGGGGNTPTQGARGETCLLSSDCESPLVCLPSPALGPGGGSIGICTDADSDVQPTGNVCGAECVTAEDCCELPVELHTTLGAKSCTDLADLIGTGDCDTATGTTVLSQRCFAQAAYCDCARNTWTCSDTGQCSYNAACSEDGLVQEGCATFSRTGRALFATCDTMDSNRCRPAVGTTICDVDADCSGLAVVDDPSDTCVDDECTCYQNNCYRKCAETLDCRAGYDCDAGTSVCMLENACTDDVTCQRLRGDVRAQCVDNACTLPCEVDLDCNVGGLTDGTFSQVCNADHMCEAIGCTQDADCPAGANGVRVFCTPRVPGMAGTSAQSAITD